MKAKKFLSILLSVVMVLGMLTMGVMASDVPPDAMPGDPGGPGEGGGGSSYLTLKDPEYDYVVIDPVTSVAGIEYTPSLHGLAQIVTGATVNGVKVTGLLTMTKDGVEVPVAEGAYAASDKVVITATNYLQAADANGNLVALGSWGAGSGEISGLPYRTALSIKDGEIVADESVSSAISGTVSGTAADGVKSKSTTSGFSAIIIQDSDYTITDAEIILDSDSDGKDANDFAGYGAGVAIYGDSKVYILDSTIEATGVAKGATFVDGGADLIVRNSTLISNGGTVYPEYKSTANQSYMINPPWVLGIAGSSRTTNVMGSYSTGTYVNTVFDADSWGAVSIDSGSYMHLTVVNCDVTVENSGYAAYAIGDGTWEDWYGTTIDVDTYAIIMTGANVNMSGVTEGQKIEVHKIVPDASEERTLSTQTGELVTTETATATAKTVVNSKNFGFMFHHNAPGGWNVLNLNEGTEINTGNAAFLVKKINAEINVNKAEVNAANGVILQMIDNDDDGVGAFMDDLYGMPTFNYSYSEPDGWSSTWGANYTESGWETEFNATNADLTGDLYNGTGYYGTNGGSVLNVNLGKGASLTGVIASTEIQHGDSEDNLYKSFTYRTDDEGWNLETASAAAGKLGHVINQNYYNGVNPVNVTLTDDAKWVVAGDSLVNNLTAKSSAVTAEKAVTVTVNGILLLDGKLITKTTTVGNVTYEVKGYDADFSDVAGDAWYADSVAWAAKLEITEGTSDSEFSPEETCSKVEILTMLWRAEGEPAAASSPIVVGGEADYQSAVDWAYDQRIIGADFNSSAPCTRADAVTYIWLAKGMEIVTSSSSFSDVGAADSCVRAVNWAVANGITAGYEDGTFRPNDICNRSHIVTFLFRAYVAPYEA